MNFATLYNEPRIYAYSLPEVGKLAGWLKIGYTDRQTVDERIRQQLKTPMLDYHIEVNEPAVCGGRFFRDSAVHKILEDRELLQIVDERGCTAPFVYSRSSSS